MREFDTCLEDNFMTFIYILFYFIECIVVSYSECKLIQGMSNMKMNMAVLCDGITFSPVRCYQITRRHS